MKRRSFLMAVGAVGGGSVAACGAEGAAEPTASKPRELPRRMLGRTGRKVSIVGFPGLSLIHEDQERCTQALHRAFKLGVNYFDVAPAYGDGDAEVKMGIGLQGLPRDEIFLACKTKKRDAQGAREELERSLARLKTDHFDVYQLHHLRQPDEVKQALGPGGAMETILKAKEEGKLRFIGFSAHTTKGALAAMQQFRFDTVMFPINFVEYFTLGFGKQVLELAKEQGAGVLAIKAMSRGTWPKDVKQTRKWWYRSVEDMREIDLAMRFTLSLEPVVAGFSPSFVDLFERAVEVSRNYRPITEPEREELRKLAATCNSVFRREEEQVAWGQPRHAEPLYPDSPHECCGGEYA